MADTARVAARNIGSTMPIIPNANFSSNRGVAARTINLTQLHNSVGINTSADVSFVDVNRTIIQNGLSLVTLGGRGSTFNINDPSVNIELKYDETMGGWFIKNNSGSNGLELLLAGNQDKVISQDASRGRWAPIERGDVIKLGDQQITFDLLPARSGEEMLERVLANDPAISRPDLIKAIPEIAGRLGQFFVDLNTAELKFKPNSDIDRVVAQNDPIRAKLKEHLKEQQAQVGYSVRNGDIDHKGEDYIYVGGQIVVGGKNYRIFGLFDGISQHGKGRYASKEAAKYINEFIHSDQARNIATPEELLNRAFVYAHNKLTQKGFGSGTTAVVLLVDEKNGKGYVSHVGDSRLYAVKDNGLVECLTEDHDNYNLLKREAKPGEVFPAREFFGRLAGTIGRALGHLQGMGKASKSMPVQEIYLDATPDIASFDLKGISKLILGSDGLPDLTGGNRPVDLNEKSSQKLAQDLTALARNTVKYDDASAVVINLTPSQPAEAQFVKTSLIRRPGVRQDESFAYYIDYLKRHPNEYLLLGRNSGSDECNVQLEDSHRIISSKHARIAYDGKNFWVMDENSKNGTFRNGERIESGKWVQFNENDTLNIGTYFYNISTGDWKNPLAQTSANAGQSNDSRSPRAIAGVVQPIVDQRNQRDQEQKRKEDEKQQVEKQMNELLARMSQAAAGIDGSRVTLGEIKILYDQFKEHVNKTFPLLKGDRLVVALKIVFQSLGINSWHQVGWYSSTSDHDGYQQTIDRNGAWISFRIGDAWHIVDPYTGVIGNYNELSCRPKEIDNRDTLSYEDLYAPPKIL